MKILFTVLAIAVAAILGMFYWMYKARSGELELSAKAWHFKLLHYMWDIDILAVNNACPYYWSIVVSLIVLTPYIAIRYIIAVPSKWIVEHWPKSKKPKKLRKPWRVPTINITVPDTLKGLYSLIYRKGKVILGWLFGIGMVIGCGYLAIWLLIYPFTHFPVLMALLITGAIFFVLWSFMIHLAVPQWDKYHVDHYVMFCKGLWGIITMPFVVGYNILAAIFGGLFGIISDNCPPIKWVE